MDEKSPDSSSPNASLSSKNSKTTIINANNILAQEDIKSNLKQPKFYKNQTSSETITFLIFGITLSIIVFLVFDVSLGQRVGSAIRKEFNGYDTPFQKVDSKEKYTSWVRELIGYTYETEYYPGRERDLPLKPEVAYSNNYVSMIRIVQRRMKLVKSGYKDFTNYEPLIWENDGFDYDDPKQDYEDTNPYGPNRIYKYVSQYKLLGYLNYIDIFRNDKNSSLQIMDDFDRNNWVDSQTRSIVVDFVLYNPYLKLYTYVNVLLLFSKTGSVQPKLALHHIKKDYYSWQGETYVRGVCEVVWVVIMCIYVIQQPFLVWETYKKVQSEIEDCKTIKRRLPKKNNIDQNNNNERPNKFIQCCLDFTKLIGEKIKLVITVIYVHFSNFWNVLDMLCISLSLAYFIYWLQFIWHMNTFTVNANSFEDPLMNDRFLYASQILSKCRYLNAFNLVIIYMRILKCLGFFTERVSVLYNSLNKAKYDILNYMILIAAVIAAFMMFLYIYFGPGNELYSEITSVLTCLFQFMNWWYGNFDSLLESDIIVGVIIFVSFMIIVVFILLNMLVGFILKGYKEANEELKNRISGRDTFGKKVEFKIDVHWYISFKEFIWRMLGIISKNYKKYLTKNQEERSHFEKILIQNKIENEDFDKEYDPLKSLSQEKSKIPLTSHYLENQANINRDKRCGRVFYSTLLYLVFLCVYIILLVQQINVQKGNAIVSSAYDKIVYDVKIRLDNNTQSSVFTLTDVADLEYLAAWVRKAMPMFVAGSELRYNMLTYIVGDEFKITFRKGKKYDARTPFDKDFARIGLYEDLKTGKRIGEKTAPIIGVEQNYFYSETGGFDEQGGYITYWNSNETIMLNQTESFVLDKIIGPDMWIFAIEFVVFEPTSSLYLYNAISIVLPNTGEIIRNLISFPLYLPLSNTKDGICLIVLETIFMVFLAYYMINYFMEMIYKWKDYTTWIENERPYFSKLQLYQRIQKCPEFIRQLKYTFNMYRIFDILFFGCAIVSIIYWIIYRIKITNLVLVMPYSHVKFDFHTQMYNIYLIQEKYINFSAISIIILSIRLLEFLQYAGSIQIYISALKKAQEDLFYFIIIFISLMLGFAGMASIAFGEYSAQFMNLGDSFISCLIMILGEFNISSILVENRTAGTIFIFGLLILFTYILLNVFLAILEINFTSASEETIKINDGIRKINALLCCWLKEDEIKNEEKVKEIEKYELGSALEILENLNLNVDIMNESFKWWAEGLTKQLYMELKQRELMKSNLNNSIQAISIKDIKDENNEDFIKTIIERKNYLLYLKTVNQLFEYQIKGTEEKIKKLDYECNDSIKIYDEKRVELRKITKINKEIEKELSMKFQEAQNLQNNN